MNKSHRIIVNTIAQYVRTVINILLSLYTVRIILDSLGATDYGIYSLVAGVTAMLAFVTNALVTTTQRYMSFYQGKKDIDRMKEVFSNSLFIHLAFGLFLVILLSCLVPILFSGFLNIPTERLDASKFLYIIIVVILFLTFCTAPYRALLVSHENIVYISFVDIVDGFLKLLLVSFLPFVDHDKLIVFGLLLLFVQLFNLFALGGYSFIKYEECVFPKLSFLNINYFKEISSFSGWVIYGTGCAMARTQGLAIVVNKFLSTIANASYGLGLQIASAVSTVSTSLLNAMRPQIVKSEGSGNHNQAMRLSFILCKFSFYLMTLICIPTIIEMPQILKLWLKEVPEYSVLFARMALFAGLADSLTLGLSVTNEAIGNVKQYNLCIATLKLLTLPISWLFISYTGDPIFIAYCYVGIELISAFVRLPFLKKTGGLSISRFFFDIILPEILPLISIVLVSLCITLFPISILRIFCNYIICSIIFILFIYLFGITKNERIVIKNIFSLLFIKKT